MYGPFVEVHETDITEKDRPSRQSSAEKRGDGMPLIPLDSLPVMLA